MVYEVPQATLRSVAASDAFFPFRDGLDAVAAARETLQQELAQLSADVGREG